MKAKLFIASAAMLSLFAACTQDEMPVAVEETGASAARIEAGVAEITTNDLTRFNVLNAANPFENGDKLGLYLMDEFEYQVEGVLTDANKTPWTLPEAWVYGWNNGWVAGPTNVTTPSYASFQSTKTGMYQMVNNIQTNYQYVYNDGKWVNPATKLVEGNYILMYPQNEVATNRRDLWYAINPEITLEKAADKNAPYFRGYDNNVFLGYQRVLRDQKSENGVLSMRADLKTVMTYLKIALYNGSSADFIPEKIVFTDPSNNVLPTMARIEPSNLFSMLEVKDAEGVDECGNKYVYNVWNDKVGNDGNFSQDDARAITTWFSPTATGHIPYGATEAQAKDAYKYVFNFPADVHIGGNRDLSEASVATVAITLPPYAGLSSLVARVYGKLWDQTLNDGEGGYRRGYFAKVSNIDMNAGTYTKENASFGLENVPVWQEGKDIPTVTVKVDDLSFIREEMLYVSTTTDLYNLVEAKISEAQNTKNYNFTISVFGNETVELNAAIDKMVSDYNKANGASQININFATQNVGKLTLTAEDVLGKDCYDFSGANVVVAAKQVLAKDGKNWVNALSIENNSTIESADHNIWTVVDNKGIMSVATGYVSTIYNTGSLTLDKAASAGTINNASTECEVVGAGVNVTTMTNAATCGTCGKSASTVTVTATGAITIGDLTNNGLVENAGMMTVNGNNYGTVNNAGVLNVGTTGNFSNYKVINNTGKINVAAYNGELTNYALINAKAGTINNVKNTSIAPAVAQIVITNNKVEIAPVATSAGELIFVMAEGATEHVKKGSADKRITLVNEATTESVIGEFAKLTGSTIVRTAYDITFEAAPKFGFVAMGVKTIEVTADAVFQGQTTGQAINLAGITIDVVKGNLDIEGAAQLTCAAIKGNHHVGAGATVNGVEGGTKHNAKH